MSKEANDLIERAEREDGGRWDDPNSNAIEILLGALSRELGQHSHKPEDDLAVGILIKDDIENGEEKRRQDEALRAMLLMGLSPDDIHKLGKNGK